MVCGEELFAGGGYGAVRAVAPVQCVPEQLPLPRPFRGRRGVGQLQDVAEAVAPGAGVVLEQCAAGVEPADGVRDPALDRLGQPPAVPGGPVRQQLTRLVRALEHGVDGLPGESRRSGIQPGTGEFGRAHQ